MFGIKTFGHNLCLGLSCAARAGARRVPVLGLGGLGSSCSGAGAARDGAPGGGQVLWALLLRN